MRIKTNPIIDIECNDIVTLRKAKRLCNEFIDVITQHTISDDGCIVCADNGEVLITEKELYTVYDVLTRLQINFEDAPNDAEDEHKILAIEFHY